MEDPNATKKKEVRYIRASESGRDDIMVVSSEGRPGSDGEEAEDHSVVACEGYRMVSWIWMDAVGGSSTTGEEMDAGAYSSMYLYVSEPCFPVLRCEFAKSWARAWRWTEEVELLKEEMRRTIVTLRGRACIWEARAIVDPTRLGPDYIQGLSAYAFSQVDLLSRLAQKYEHAWTGVGNGIEAAESDPDLEDDLHNLQREEQVEEAEEGL